MSKGRLVYSDALRISAVFSVIFLHVACVSWGTVAVNSPDWCILNFYASSVRWGVPVFVMISGMFFLDPERELSLKRLYSSSIFRVFCAFIFWSFIYFIYAVISSGNPLTMNSLYRALELISQGKSCYHLWFLPMLIGLYIITPVLRFFTAGARDRDYYYFFVLFFLFASLFPTLFNFPFFERYKPLVENLDLHLVLGYVGFYVLGFYLKKAEISPKITYTVYFFGVISLLFTIFATYYASITSNCAVDIFNGYLTPNTICLSIGIFLFFKNIFGKIVLNDNVTALITGLSKASFGIYLVHVFFISYFVNAGYFSYAPVFYVPIISCVIFLLSFFVSRVLLKLPFLNRYIV